MMADVSYLSFVKNHAAIGFPNTIWWEDDSWLDSNFSLSMTLFLPLNPEERRLCRLYPIEAFQIFLNKGLAESWTQSKMGTSVPDNGKENAFKHAFYTAINARDVGETVARLFADAHEMFQPPAMQLSMEMDLYNNNVGILFGKNLVVNMTSGSNDGIADAIKNKLDNGELIYLKNLGPNNSIIFGTYKSPTNQ